MDRIILFLETIFQNLPLSLMEIWGSFAFIIGLVLMILAYGGFTLRTGDNWSFGRESQAWDEKSLIAMGISFVTIFITGYIGSFFVLVPGAQTFESLKDLSVFLCIILFGYPALIAVPFAYGLTDLWEGVPPEFVIDWLVGYFINPACFWLAYQFIGKDPDFKKSKTWRRYLTFVLLFMLIEPPLWGYICAGKFTSRISYNVITPALFFTTSITWILAPFATMVAFPLTKRFKLYWADIPLHVKQKLFGTNEWIWQSGHKKHAKDVREPHAGIPVRLFLLIPFISVILITVGITAFFTIRNSEKASMALGEQLQYEMSENLKLKLDEYNDSKNGTIDQIVMDGILKNSSAAKFGKLMLLNRSGEIVAQSYPIRKGRIANTALTRLKNLPEGIEGITKPIRLNFAFIDSKPLSRETWIALATPYKENFILVNVLPETFFMAGSQAANSQSAMIFAIALTLVIVIATILGSMVVNPIQEVCTATVRLSEGEYSERVPRSKLREIDMLATAFNNFADQQVKTMENLIIQNEENLLNEYRLNAAVEAANIGIWEWNIETNNLYWNDKMYEHYGVKNVGQKLDYETWLQNVSAEDHERLTKEVLETLVGNREFNSEFKVSRADNSFRYIRAISTTIRNEMGRAVRMIGINLDITDKKLSDIEIQRYRNHLQELVDIRTEALMRKTEEVKELSEKQAKSEIYEKFAQIFLSMRDNANSPLQVQRLVIAMLRKYYPEREDLIKHLEESVDALTSMNKIFTRLDSKIAMTNDKIMSETEILKFLDEFEKRV